MCKSVHLFFYFLTILLLYVAVCFRYHNQTMINYSPHTGKIVTLEDSGFQSVLIVSRKLLYNGKLMN